MPLTGTQLTQLKAAVVADAVLNALPQTADSNLFIAAAFNLTAVPDYWVWRSSVTRSEVYHQTGLGTDGVTQSVWDWATFKAQTVPEQNSWTQMFMGDTAPVGKLNLRDGIFNIFNGGVGTASGKQRVHILNVSRRKATRAEKLFAVVVVATGGILPTVDTGNTIAQARGSALNPDNLGFEGAVTAADVDAARNLP
jgi:hypothetical protein